MASKPPPAATFVRLAPDGDVDPEHGIRMFIVGTGGHFSKGGEFQPLLTREVFHDEFWDSLKMSLYESHHTWSFAAVDGNIFSDAGSDGCVERTQPDNRAY